MSRSNMLLSNSRRIATDQRTRATFEEHYQHTAPVALGAAPTFAGRWLRAASAEAFNVDGSGTPAVYALDAGDDEVLRIYRLRLVLEVATAPDWTKFGDLAALTTGLGLAIVDADDATIVDLLDGEKLKSNADLATVFDVVEVATLGGTFALLATLTFPVPLRLDGGVDESLCLTVADNLAGLTRARLRADGYDEAALR